MSRGPFFFMIRCKEKSKCIVCIICRKPPAPSLCSFLQRQGAKELWVQCQNFLARLLFLGGRPFYWIFRAKPLLISTPQKQQNLMWSVRRRETVSLVITRCTHPTELSLLLSTSVALNESCHGFCFWYFSYILHVLNTVVKPIERFFSLQQLMWLLFKF